MESIDIVLMVLLFILITSCFFTKRETFVATTNANTTTNTSPDPECCKNTGLLTELKLKVEKNETKIEELHKMIDEFNKAIAD